MVAAQGVAHFVSARLSGRTQSRGFFETTRIDEIQMAAFRRRGLDDRDVVTRLTGSRPLDIKGESRHEISGHCERGTRGDHEDRNAGQNSAFLPAHIADLVGTGDTRGL